MAYPRPTYDSRAPHDLERARPAWDPLRSHYSSIPPPSHHSNNMTGPNILDPESDTSDVSDDGREPFRARGQPYLPVAIPMPPPKRAMESLENIEGRLRELQHVEDRNIQKQDHLKAKRARKDEKIMRKREAQDAAIKLIMEARARRDGRVLARRKLEDEAFEAFDRNLEEEENNLHRQKKRLKRGLPVDDIAMGSGVSNASMSPPGPSYANIPPPAKRHQTGPPGQNDSPITSNPRPLLNNPPPPPTPTGPNPPPYAFLQSNHPPSTVSYGHSPTMSHSPSNASGPFPPGPRAPQPQQQGQPSPYTINGHPPSPQVPRPPPATTSSILNTVPPPRVVSTYDTRPPPPQSQPPPPTSSGFATINTPPASGFAPINARNTATPPAPPSLPLAKSNEHDRSNGYTRPYVSEGTPTGGSGPAGSKRTPSTTHPYQMSEAFANRHHHCERTDHLNRGIWTSYGHGGTKELPTGPAQEMYLRCNHDGCRRIDWRTVHGLQCHIVKSHEQPKGTIGSLEKALERYGVPVAEVEAYEREHGDGTGGTMADPKNFKLKAKPSHLSDKSDGQRRSVGPSTNSALSKTSTPTSAGGSAVYHQDSPASARGLHHEDTESSDNGNRTTPGNVNHGAPQPLQPSNRFAAVNGGWSTIPDVKTAEAKDVTMRDSPASPHASNISGVPQRDAAFWRRWPENNSPISKMEPVNKAPVGGPVQSIVHESPAVVPSQQSPPNVATHNRSISISRNSTAQMPEQNEPLTPVKPQSREPQPSPNMQGKDAGPQTPKTNTTTTKEQQSGVVEDEVKKTSGVANTSAQLASITQPTAPVSTQDADEVKAAPKEPEKPKPEIIESARVEPKSPMAVTRRASLIGGRRESSRRSSVAAIRAEKEREKERDEITIIPSKPDNNTATEPQPEVRREKKPEVVKTADPEQDREIDREDQEGGGDDSDDPDTIKVGSASSRDKDRERELRTTPKRQSNGRFLRKHTNR